MNLHLFIPSLFWSDMSYSEVYHDLALPATETLLSKSKVTTHPAYDYSAWLCRAFNIEKQLDWPVAPIMLQTENTDDLTVTKSDYWLRADPVHLRIEQNHIMLADNYAFELTHEEAIQFTNVINAHLNGTDIILLPLDPYRWYIRLPARPDMRTHILQSATCKNINTLLPTGKDSMKWHRIFNEIQMLLHEHPLNQARADHHQVAINSIWFWGGGQAPQTVRSDYTYVWSNERFSRTLANLSHTPNSRLPENVENWPHHSQPEYQLLVLDTLLNKDKYNLAYEWRENLKELEKNWLSPIYTALKNNQINELKISTTNENFSCDFVIKQRDLWKFWKAIKPLPSYAVK